MMMLMVVVVMCLHGLELSGGRNSSRLLCRRPNGVFQKYFFLLSGEED
jgi:hypothetical protein